MTADCYGKPIYRRKLIKVLKNWTKKLNSSEGFVGRIEFLPSHWPREGRMSRANDAPRPAPIAAKINDEVHFRVTAYIFLPRSWSSSVLFTSSISSLEYQNRRNRVLQMFNPTWKIHDAATPRQWAAPIGTQIHPQTRKKKEVKSEFNLSKVN